MVYAGKELYLKDVLLPNATDAQKMGYEPQQITWCKENEAEMWRFFPAFGLAMGRSVASFGVRFSFYWQTVGAPVSVSFILRGNCRKET